MNGVYTATVSVRDLAGNIATSTPLPFIVDSTPPQLALTVASASLYGHTLTGTVYYGEGSGSFTVTATTSDPLAGLDSLTTWLTA